MKSPPEFNYPVILLAGVLLILNWSCKKEYPPTLTTLPVTEITWTTAQSGGSITDDGGASLTSQGVVWSTSENPTIISNEGLTTDEAGDGQFVSSLTGLKLGTTYYIRSYAENSAGLAYGNQEQFTTLPAILEGNICNFTDFFYYKGNPRYLGDLSNEYLRVAFDTVYSDSDINKYISTLYFLDQDYEYTIRTNPQYKFKSAPLKLVSPKNCEEITDIIFEFHKNPMVAYAHYTIKTDNCTDYVWQPIGNLCVDSYSSLFLVRVPNENDLTNLYNMISKTNTEFVEQNVFMKNWFTLRATKNSDGDAARMANYFYESGLFDATQPDIVKHPVE